ncbi:hypothetical protein PHYBOEH_008033 [Phytophthora boehmeriae]|uniref:Uncharacterized protein n=1 Tax=Phytophthora boehmeriae TaxID=109152 RepID=A0A8T1W6Z0_9STRA|nr:hypothetical protein PHYBOEH_008033 [Phytophthora boehmeriae]
MSNNTVARTPDEGTTCLYASKRCTNPRATKRNGQLHQFCETHRRKANFSQRQLDQKRHLQQELARLQQSSTPVSIPPQFANTPLDDNGELDLSDEEIELLLEMVSAQQQ